MSAITPAEPVSSLKPLPTELDVFGLTHVGRVRQTNADHFMVASFYRAMRVHASSLEVPGDPVLSRDSRGYLLLVADGVGALVNAPDGSAKAAEAIAQSLLQMGEISHAGDAEREARMRQRLCDFIKEAHDALVAYGHEEGGAAATTITCALALWPRAFIAHVGDSRCYRYRDGALERMTTDQTMAQAMIDAGVVKPGSVEAARLGNVLISALGGNEVDIQVHSHELRRTDRWLLCTDGLTKHVSETELAEVVGGTRSATEMCSHLRDLALERGGEDNITIVIGRLKEN